MPVTVTTQLPSWRLGAGARRGGADSAAEVAAVSASSRRGGGGPGGPGGTTGPGPNKPHHARASANARHQARQSTPTTLLPQSESYVGGSDISVGGSWDGSNLEAETRLEVPLTFGGLLVAFVLVQWLIDRRDPKFVEAPVRREDDSIGFE